MRGKTRAARATARDRAADAFGVIIAGNMACPGDRGLRIAQEVRHYAADGMKVGLLQAAPPPVGSRIAPEIQSCVRRGLATVITPTDVVETDLLVVHAPAEVAWAAGPLARVTAQRATLVCHRAEDFGVKRLGQRLKGVTEFIWAPTNRWLREMAPSGLSLTPGDWLPQPAQQRGSLRPRSAEAAKTIGWMMSAASIPPPTGAANLLVLDLQREVGISLDRLDRLDGLAFFPSTVEVELPDAMICTALDAGMAVALPHWLRPHYGPNARYCTPEEAVSVIGAPRRAKAASFRQGKRSQEPVATSASEQRPVMFLASNGVGIGHLSRLAAIARRMDTRFPILFATQAQAVGAVERLGYLTEYMPSAGAVGGDFEAWDEWFRYELEKLLDAYDPALVVYDGNNPSNGLVRAVAPRRDCRLAWVRRGLWGTLNSPVIDNSRWFDLIIEPGELDGQPDAGVTAQRRDEAMTVAPIRLLDEKELLPRGEATKALGLDPGRPAALIQLGAGYNRDVVSLIDQLVGALRQVPHLQICIAEWANGAQSLNYWPDVSYLRGYPLSQYFKAFDFSIAAAGYNTFHEVMNFNLPTIFIPNRHPTMDDQAGRATHAQALQAAFELDEDDLSDLPDLVTLLMDAKARTFLMSNSGKLHRSNGAAEAAQALTALLEATP